MSVLPQASEDAVAALTTLGYSERDARKRVQQHCVKDPDASIETLIKQVLQS